MPIDSNIPLQVRPQQPINPFGDIMQIMQLKQAQQLLPLKIQEAQQNQQESAMRLQQMQQAVNDRKALDAAYSGAVTNDPDTGLPTFDRTKLSDALIKAGQGHQIPTLLKTLDDSAEAHTKLQKAQADLQQIHTENGAAIGAGAAATGYDPAFFRNRLAIGVANGSLDPKNAQPIIQQLDQANQQDPTGAAAKAIVQKYSQSLMDQSEKMRNALGSQARGAAATSQAATAAGRETRLSGEEALKQATGALATNPPKDAEAYQQFIDALPHGVASRILQAVPVEQYDPKTAADAFNKAGMTANERFKADNPNATGERNPTEVTLALAVAAGKKPGATPAEVQASKDAELALKRLDQSKREARPVTNVTLTPAQQDDTAQMLVEGRIDPGTARTLLRRNPALLSQARAKDSSFDEVDIDNRYNTAKEFTSSSNGKAGGQVLALNTLIHHADLYLEAADALKNGSFKPGNAAYNAVSAMFGGPAPQNAALVARFLAGETGKVATGGVPAEGEINGILANLGNNGSPQQMRQAGEKLLEIASGRMIPLKEKRDNAHLQNQFPIVGQDAAAILQKRGFDPNTLRPASKNAGGGAVKSVSSKAERDALPKGAQYTKPGDPTVYIKQ
jgi:hypothetical protein